MADSSNLLEIKERLENLRIALYNAKQTYGLFVDSTLLAVIDGVETLITKTIAEKNRLDDKNTRELLLLARRAELLDLPLTYEEWQTLKLQLPESVQYFAEDEWNDLLDSLSDSA